VAGNGDDAYKDGPAHEASFNCPIGIALGSEGDLLIADAENNRIRRVHKVAAPYTAKQLFTTVDTLFTPVHRRRADGGVAVSAVIHVASLPLVLVEIVVGYITGH
jgi:hypothetical protein